MQDAWRAYLELVLGLTEASKKKAQQVARKLVGQGGATAGQLQEMAEELLATSAANRESLAKLVRYEVDRALGVLGLASADEVADLRAQVRELERELQATQTLSAAVGTAAMGTDAGGSVGDVALAAVLEESTAPAPPPVKKTVAKKTVAKKTVAKKVTAEKKAVGATAQKPAKKNMAKKVTAEKKAGTTAPARKATGGPGAGAQGVGS